MKTINDKWAELQSAVKKAEGRKRTVTKTRPTPVFNMRRYQTLKLELNKV